MIYSNLPYYGSSLQAPFKEWLTKQKQNLHVKPGTAQPKVSNNMHSQALHIKMSVITHS